jgi:MFS family permease
MTDTADARQLQLRAISAESQARRHAVNAGAISFLLEIFDSYLPTVTLAPAIIYFEPASLSSTTKTTLFYVVFAISLLARPLAAALFGHIADSSDRRRALWIAMLGSGIFTILTAVLPGYAALGWGAIVILLLLRLVGGLFLGGVSVSSTPLALENTSHSRRGLTGAYVTAGYPLGAACVSAVTTLMLLKLPAGNAHSAFVQWGWRIPFLVGGVVTLAFLPYIRRISDEHCQSRTAQEGASGRSPIAEVMGKSFIRRLVQTTLIYMGIWFAFEGAATATPGLVVTFLKRSAMTVTVSLIAANVALVLCYFLYGWAAQRLGTRRTLIATALSNLVIGAALYALAISWIRGGQSLIPGMVLICITVLLATAQFPVAAVFTNARFPKKLRASGYGLAYNASILVPAFYSFYMLWLKNLMPYPYTPVVLIAVGGACTLAGALMNTHEEPELLEA